MGPQRRPGQRVESREEAALHVIRHDRVQYTVELLGPQEYWVLKRLRGFKPEV